MSFMRKLHQMSIYALNLCAIATLVSLTVNVLSAVVMYILEHRKQAQQDC